MCNQQYTNTVPQKLKGAAKNKLRQRDSTQIITQSVKYAGILEQIKFSSVRSFICNKIVQFYVNIILTAAIIQLSYI